jgi:hypothetical protein
MIDVESESESEEDALDKMEGLPAKCELGDALNFLLTHPRSLLLGTCIYICMDVHVYVLIFEYKVRFIF